VRCPKCQHAGTVEVMLDQVRKLRCSRCGHHAPVISGRSPLTSWSTRRRAGNAGRRRGGAP
jgi:Zn ribbon nucleic-acid-binding protein